MELRNDSALTRGKITEAVGWVSRLDEVCLEFLKAPDVVHAFTMSCGDLGRCLWTGRLGWWSPSLRRGTRGYARMCGSLLNLSKWSWRRPRHSQVGGRLSLWLP